MAATGLNQGSRSWTTHSHRSSLGRRNRRADEPQQPLLRRAIDAVCTRPTARRSSTWPAGSFRRPPIYTSAQNYVDRRRRPPRQPRRRVPRRSAAVLDDLRRQRRDRSRRTDRAGRPHDPDPARLGHSRRSAQWLARSTSRCWPARSRRCRCPSR